MSVDIKTFTLSGILAYNLLLYTNLKNGHNTSAFHAKYDHWW